MLKKLIAIVLVTELGMRYLPEKYNFVNVGNPQTAETTNGEIDAPANKKPTVSTLPEMSGIEDKSTPTTPVSNVILEEAPVVSVSEPKESTNTIAPQNDLPTADTWFIFNKTTNTITGYSSSTSAPKNINIPSTIGGVPVYNIGNSAFKDKQLTGLTLPNGLKTIGGEAFYNNPSIAGNLVIPDSVTSIGWSAFQSCNALTSINIFGKNEGEISGEPWGAASSTNVYWKDTKQVGDYVFNTTTRTINKYTGTDIAVNLPSTLVVDGINYPVKKIGEKAFEDNQTLIKVTIPDSITNIENNAFRNCNTLIRIDIPSKNEGEISGEPWDAVDSTIVFWKDIKQTGDYVFNTTTRTIKKYTGIATTVNIPSTLVVDGINYPVKKIGIKAFYQNTTLTNVKIPDSVTSIEEYAFYHCSGLTSITIPDSVTSMQRRAFSDCIGLINATIGKGLTSIDDSAFQNCSGLTSIVIPDGVTSIGYDAFCDCIGLTSVTIGNGVTSIDDNSFQNCSSLSSVTIPDSVTSIGIYAFGYCTGLTYLTIGNSVTSIGSSAFDGCSSLTSVTIPDSVTSVEDGVFRGCRSLTDVIIGNGVTYIGATAFSSCSGLTKVTIPDSVTRIESYTFEECSSLTNVMIGNSVTSIGERAFSHCSSLTRITIPDSVTNIGFFAFYGCFSLTEAIISKNITYIGSDAFGYTPALQTIYMRGSHDSLPTSIISYQPWGAPASTKVLYAGEFVTFDHTVKKVVGQYNRIIDIRAFLNKPSLINRIILPNGTIKYVAKSDWPDETGYYSYGSITEEAITSNGTYIFKGYGDDNVEQSYAVEINDIGSITLRANEAWITEQMALTISEQDVLDLLNVSAEDDAGVLTSGTDCTFWISPEDMNKIHTSHLGDVTTIRVNVKSSRSGQEMTSYRDVTLHITPYLIHADNVDLWPLQCKTITKQQLLDLMNPNVTVSEGTVDMTKLVMSDEDFNKIKTGTPGIYNVLLTYDTNKSKKQVRVTIVDDSPAALINIPSEIKMKNIDNDSVYGVGADETISIQPTAVSYYPQPFKIKTDPSFWLESTAPDAAWINRMKVVVLDANNQPLSDNHLLATLSSSTIQSVPFKLRGYHNKWNSKGAYSGNMTFTITYGDSTP